MTDFQKILQFFTALGFNPSHNSVTIFVTTPEGHFKISYYDESRNVPTQFQGSPVSHKYKMTVNSFSQFEKYYKSILNNK